MKKIIYELDNRDMLIGTRVEDSSYILQKNETDVKLFSLERDCNYKFHGKGWTRHKIHYGKFDDIVSEEGEELYNSKINLEVLNYVNAYISRKLQDIIKINPSLASLLDYRNARNFTKLIKNNSKNINKLYKLNVIINKDTINTISNDDFLKAWDKMPSNKISEDLKERFLANKDARDKRIELIKAKV